MLLPFNYKNPTSTEIYTLSLHDALPIYIIDLSRLARCKAGVVSDSGIGIARPFWRRILARIFAGQQAASQRAPRSEEHTSELQSRRDLVCRLLLEKKKRRQTNVTSHNYT